MANLIPLDSQGPKEQSLKVWCQGCRVYKLSGNLPKESTYSLFQKKRTFNSEFFCDPPGGEKPKVYMADYVNPPCEFLAPLPQGGHTKNSELNVRFVWNRLYQQIQKAHLPQKGDLCPLIKMNSLESSVVTYSFKPVEPFSYT